MKGIASGFDRTSHLTNYAVNKSHVDFEFNKDGNEIGSGHKRTIQWFRTWLEEEQGQDSASIWTSVADVVNRTLLSVQPQLAHAYR